MCIRDRLQTALEKKTADVFCKNLKKRSGVSLLQSKTCLLYTSLFCRNLCGSHDWNGRFSDWKNRDEIFRIVDRNRTGKVLGWHEREKSGKRQRKVAARGSQTGRRCV